MKKLLLIGLIITFAVVVYAQVPEWQWAKSGGGISYDSALGVALDSSGNCFVTGNFENIADFGNTQLPGIGFKDVFVAKLDANGNWLWAKQGGGVLDDFGWAICTDSAGNCYLTGEFAGTASFGLTTLTGSSEEEIFVAKLDANGNWLWAKRAGGFGADTGLGIASDNSGNCFITGAFESSASFGEISLTASGGSDIFTAKLDTNGNWLWAVRAGGTNSEAGSAITVDNSGNSYLTGSFRGSATIGTTTLVSHGGSNDMDVFIAKLDTNGNWQWAKRAGGDDPDSGYGITSDNSGNVFVTGIFYDSGADFGPFTFNNSATDEIFVVKMDSGGNWLWANHAGGIWPAYCYGLGISLDGNGNCYVTGYLHGLITFGANSHTSQGTEDIFVARLDSGGNWQWVSGAGQTGYNEGRGIATNTGGYSCVAGYFNNSVTFGATSFSSSGYSDVFIAKISPGGTAIENEDAPELSGLSQLFNAYPNPIRTGQNVTIQTDIAKGETGSLSIYNLRGQKIAEYGQKTGENHISFDSSGLAAGMYFYQLKTQTANTVKKLVLLK